MKRQTNRPAKLKYFEVAEQGTTSANISVAAEVRLTDEQVNAAIADVKDALISASQGEAEVLGREWDALADVQTFNAPAHLIAAVMCKYGHVDEVSKALIYMNVSMDLFNGQFSRAMRPVA